MDPLPPDPYVALNVPRDASPADIKKAYRKMALKYHPDKSKDSAEDFHRVQQAYELIGDDESRRKYDDQVRLADLRKDVYTRRGSGGYSPNVDIRTAAFDFRSSPGPGTAFQARGPPRYEERRPSNPAATGSPAPRSPYADGEAFDSYFQPRPASRKYDGYDGSSRKAPPMKATPTKAMPRSEDLRDSARQDKFSSSKVRNEKKKQRDQEKGRERKGKYAASFVSVDSDGDDDVNFDASRMRDDYHPEQERLRKENRGDYHNDPRSEKFINQSSHIKDYINRSKVEGGPVEKGSTPRHQPQRTSSSQELPMHTRPPPSPQDAAYDVRRMSRDARPAMVRKSSSRPKERASESPRSKEKASEALRGKESPSEPLRTKESPEAPKPTRTPAKTSSKTTAEKPSPEPLHTTSERRPPPPLYTSNSSPGNLKIPKARTMDEAESKGNPPPRMERSTTMPTAPASKRSSTRKDSTTPAVPSNLRQTETNHDSGYSTSNSPSETPQPQQSYSTTYHHYGVDSVQVDTSGENFFGESNRPLRRSPSPVSDALPRDQERSRPSMLRERGTSSRSASFQSPATLRHEVEQNRDSRRPSLDHRTSSSRPGSSSRMPTLQRGASSPMPTTPMRTGGPPGTKDSYLYREIPADTPTFREPNYNGPSSNGRYFSDEAESRRRYSPEEMNYGPQGPHRGSSGYYSSNSGRRGSEDLGRSKAEAANNYIDSRRERSGPGPAGLRRGSTFA